MTSKQFALGATAVTFVLFALILFSLNGKYSPRPVSFSGAVERLGMMAPDIRIPIHGVLRIDVVGCRLTLNGVSVQTASGDAIAIAFDRNPALEPKTGQLVSVTLEGGTNLDAKGGRSKVDVKAIDRGIEWSFWGERTINLVATSVTIEDTSNLDWPGVKFQTQPPKTVRLSSASSLKWTCRPDPAKGARATLGFMLWPTEPADAASPAYVDLEMEVLPAPTEAQEATDFELKAPRGAVAIGTKTTALGAGDLKVTGGGTVERVRRTLEGRPVIDVSLTTRSSDVTLAGDQLVDSWLEEAAGSPAWTTLAAVVAVALSAAFSKLFDYAWPPPKDGV